MKLKHSIFCQTIEQNISVQCLQKNEHNLDTTIDHIHTFIFFINIYAMLTKIHLTHGMKGL